MAEVYTKRKARLMVYTRKADEAQYPGGLARSIHMAVSRDGKYYEALNGNYGILFAQALVDDADILRTKGVKNPWIFEMSDGGFGIIAVRVNEDGSIDQESRGLFCSGRLRIFRNLRKSDFFPFTRKWMWSGRGADMISVKEGIALCGRTAGAAVIGMR